MKRFSVILLTIIVLFGLNIWAFSGEPGKNDWKELKTGVREKQGSTMVTPTSGPPDDTEGPRQKKDNLLKAMPCGTEIEKRSTADPKQGDDIGSERK